MARPSIPDCVNFEAPDIEQEIDRYTSCVRRALEDQGQPCDGPDAVVIFRFHAGDRARAVFDQFEWAEGDDRTKIEVWAKKLLEKVRQVTQEQLASAIENAWHEIGLKAARLDPPLSQTTLEQLTSAIAQAWARKPEIDRKAPRRKFAARPDPYQPRVSQGHDPGTSGQQHQLNVYQEAPQQNQNGCDEGWEDTIFPDGTGGFLRLGDMVSLLCFCRVPEVISQWLVS